MFRKYIKRGKENLRKSFKYLITSSEVTGADGRKRRVYGLKITAELKRVSRETVAELRGVTECPQCAAQLRDTLERHRVTPAHAPDVVCDLLYQP
jgi:hypothetical protein